MVRIESCAPTTGARRRFRWHVSSETEADKAEAKAITERGTRDAAVEPDRNYRRGTLG